MKLRYHVNEQGEPGACRAVKRPCPFGTPEEHYATKEQARKGYEEKQALELAISMGTARANPAVDRALTAPLTYDGPDPAWMAREVRMGEKMFGTRPRILDVVDSPVGKLAVLWTENSTSKLDVSIQQERGLVCNRISYRKWDSGEEMGHVTVGYLTDESVERSWGNDEWTGLRYCDEFLGKSYGFNFGKDVRARKTFPIEEASTPEELLEAKKYVWAKTHASFDVVPEDFDTSQLTWGSLVNLKPDHAPLDEEKLDLDLARIRGIADEQLAKFKQNHQQPSIDYAEVEPPLRGKGLGAPLYVYAARVLGQRGKTLCASGLQTEFADRMWLRLARHERIPSSVKTYTYLPERGNDRKTQKITIDFSGSV